jgi:lipopolysaccharide transport system ATP-binding protein
MAIAIKAENLSKAYQLGEFSTGTLSRDIERAWYRLRGKEDPFLKIGETNDRTTKGTSDIVWSLKDVNFEIQQGDAVGIVGRNGAGKSTLLKVLSRVTSPTTGSVKLKGRIASLLEVGTGFHPELTGRENIFLNGAILGMRKYEIKRKFDEIVDFAGVERYIDTPVKRYSSGMYVRLAFAVAAFLEPEILVVDEVLAVGDAEFQKKCLGRMQDVSKNDGRTVLFVSHNMAAVANLCNKAIFMRNGTLQSMGLTHKIVEEYISYGKQFTGEVLEKDIRYTRACEDAYFNAIRITSNNEITSNIDSKDEAVIELEYTIKRENASIYPSIHLLDNMGTCILASFTGPSATKGVDPYFGKPLKKGQYKSTMVIPGNFLNDKTYRINVFLVPEDVHGMAVVEDILTFSVFDTGEMRKEYTGEWTGLIRPRLEWNTQYLNA